MLANLKSPSTYKRIDYQEMQMLQSDPPYHFVTINYDAQNSYGALIRESSTCEFPIVSGRTDTGGYIDSDGKAGTSAELQESVDRMLAEETRPETHSKPK